MCVPQCEYRVSVLAFQPPRAIVEAGSIVAPRKPASMGSVRSTIRR
jgi:hypothetical protein